MRFEWDEVKDRANIRAHRVSFEEARTVFFDEDAVVYDDPDHSADEQKFLLLGVSALLRVLLVVHALRDGGDTIRIISARRATRAERASYPGGGR
ncbi:MAG: BrnT family toxin [Deltaproteobacteria bacterium]|nr:BrnT family toxin [Deltaproteobacteria bacterium]